jgi:hypothetical protein
MPWECGLRGCLRSLRQHFGDAVGVQGEHDSAAGQRANLQETSAIHRFCSHRCPLFALARVEPSAVYEADRLRRRSLQKQECVLFI